MFILSCILGWVAPRPRSQMRSNALRQTRPGYGSNLSYHRLYYTALMDPCDIFGYALMHPLLSQAKGYSRKGDALYAQAKYTEAYNAYNAGLKM